MREYSTSFLARFIASIVLVKIIYYGWAIDGFYLYFAKVRTAEEQSAVPYMCKAMLMLVILNLMEMFRIFMIILTFTVIHIVCSRRARRHRMRVMID